MRHPVAHADAVGVVVPRESGEEADAHYRASASTSMRHTAVEILTYPSALAAVRC